MNYDGNFDLGFDGEWIGLFQFALAAQYLLQRAAVQKYPRKTFAKSFWIMYNIFAMCSGAKLSKKNICPNTFTSYTIFVARVQNYLRTAFAQ